MIYENNPQLRKWLEKDFPKKALMASFDFDQVEYDKHLVDVARRPDTERRDAAAFRCLTSDKPPEKIAQGFSDVIAEFGAAAERHRGIHAFDVDERKRYNKQAWVRFGITTLLLLVLILLFAAKGHAQNVNPALVVAVCGVAPAPYPAAGNRAPETVDVNGNLCAGVSVSATIATAGLAVGVTAGISTSGIVGTPVFAAASTSAPTYVGGTYNPLSADLTGAIRVNGTFSAAANQTVDVNLIKGTPELTPGKIGVLAIAGADTAGSATSAYPVGFGGRDGTGTRRDVLTSATGAVVIDSAGTAVPISAASLPLPALAATSTKQSDGSQKTQLVDSGGNVVTVTGNKLDVNATVSAAANQTVDINLIKGTPELTPGKVGVLAIAGADTSGSTSSAYPVLVSALSGSNAQSLVMSTSGSGLKVDGSGYTQPVSGTVTVTDGAGALNVIVDSGTISLTNGQVVTAQLTTANLAVNLTQVDGTAGKAVLTTWATAAPTVTVTDGAGALNVIVDSGTVSLTNGQVVTAQFTTTNVAVNIAQLGASVISSAVTAGIMPVAGTVTAGTNDTKALPIQGVSGGVAVVENLNQIAGVAVTTGSGTSASTLRVVMATPDPCAAGFTPVGLPATVSIATSTTVITGTTGQHVYICGINLGPMGTATNIALVSGTGTLCATSIAGLAGGTTAANGWNFAANGGINQGYAHEYVYRTSATGQNICLILSAANQVPGSIKYVVAP